MSAMAISPVPFVNATSVSLQEPQAQSHLQEDTQQARAQTSPDGSSSGISSVAAQAFTAFSPNVQPIASLSPSNEMPQALPVDVGPDSNGSLPKWSGAMVDVYA